MRYGRARKVNGLPLFVNDHLRRAKIVKLFCSIYFFDQGCQLCPWLVKATGYKGYLLRCDKRFIALYIDDDIIFRVLGSYFGTTVCPALVLVGCHRGYTAKPDYMVKNALIIGSNNNLMQAVTFFCLLVNALQHAFTGNINQWLAGKAGRGVTRGYDA